MVIELKGLEPGQSAAFSDRTGFFMNQVIMDIFCLYSVTLSGATLGQKVGNFIKKLPQGK